MPITAMMFNTKRMSLIFWGILLSLTTYGSKTPPRIRIRIKATNQRTATFGLLVRRAIIGDVNDHRITALELINPPKDNCRIKGKIKAKNQRQRQSQDKDKAKDKAKTKQKTKTSQAKPRQSQSQK